MDQLQMMYSEIRAVSKKCNDAADAMYEEMQRSENASDRTAAVKYFMECHEEKKDVLRRCLALEAELLSKSATPS